jgi:hypothetical protein
MDAIHENADEERYQGIDAGSEAEGPVAWSFTRMERMKIGLVE